MVRNRKETTEKSKKKPGLSTQIFIALLAGALLGVVIHYWIPSSYIKDTVIVEGVLYVIGQGFIRLMQMLVVPLVFCSLVCGSMSIGDSKTLGKVGVKTIGFYLVTTALAVCIALGTALLIHPGLGLNMSAVQKANLSSTAADSSVSLVDTLLNIIPKNPIGSMANGDMLPIIVFALFVGVMLAKLGNRASVVSNFISQFNDVMMEMTMTVMKVAPVGVFCLIARTFATVGFSAFAPMLKYMGNVTLALALQCFVIYQVLLFVFTRLNPIKFVKKFLPVMGFAFSTATSNATIPMSIDTLNKKDGCLEADFFVHHSARRNHQHGWYLHYAGCRCHLHRRGVRYSSDSGKPRNGCCYRNTGFHRYRWYPKRRTCYPGYGTEFRRTANGGYRSYHGYRPYSRYAAYRRQHHRRCCLHNDCQPSGKGTQPRSIQSQLTAINCFRKAFFRHALRLRKRVPVFGNPCGFRRERVFLILFFCYSSNAWRMLS